MILGEAVFDPTKLYRYRLTRNWGSLENKGIVTWVMLNPSTADATQDDPTIRRCISFSKGWGYSGLIITNLYALRSTNPKGLLQIDDPIGPDNAKYVEEAIQESQLVIGAWGAFKLGVPTILLPILSTSPIYCLGTTQQGHPKHPLYVKSATERVKYESL